MYVGIYTYQPTCDGLDVLAYIRGWLDIKQQQGAAA